MKGEGGGRGVGCVSEWTMNTHGAEFACCHFDFVCSLLGPGEEATHGW